MYLTYNETNYPCKAWVGNDKIYRGLPEDFPFPVSGEIILCADDGFELRRDVAEDYLRQTFENGVLTLTNTPEPEPVEPTPEPEPEPDMWDELANAIREGVDSV